MAQRMKFQAYVDNTFAWEDISPMTHHEQQMIEKRYNARFVTEFCNGQVHVYSFERKRVKRVNDNKTAGF